MNSADKIKKFTPIPLKKHKGKTLPQVLFTDPDWFFWALKKDAFYWSPQLQEEARFLYKRAISIRIPQRRPEPLVAEYWTFNKDGSFATMQLVPKSQPPIEKGSFRKDVIDLSIPFKLKIYDKLGYRIMLKCLRDILFGGKRIRMTKERCEEFFLDDTNFVLS